MKLFWTALLLCLTLGTYSYAIEAPNECKQCGMDRNVFNYSRMLISYKDGTTVGVCSLNCAVTEMGNNKHRKVILLQVADHDSQALIEAGKAVWVMGGKKQGVMTQRPKWAFATKESAQKFIALYGGTITTWAEVLSAAKADAKLK